MNKKIEKNFENIWQEKFDSTAKSCTNDFEKSVMTEHGAKGHERYFFTNFKELNLKKKGKILDMGCGPGNYCQTLTKMGYEVYGVDFSKEMIKISKKRDILHRITYKQSDICHLPFSNDYFDLVISIGVFQTVQNHKKALKELYRVIKPGGTFYLDTLNRNSIKHLLVSDTSNLKRYYYSQLREDCRKTGFIQVKANGIYCFHPKLRLLENLIIDVKLYKILDIFMLLSQYGANSFILRGKK